MGSEVAPLMCTEAEHRWEGHWLSGTANGTANGSSAASSSSLDAAPTCAFSMLTTDRAVLLTLLLPCHALAAPPCAQPTTVLLLCPAGIGNAV